MNYFYVLEKEGTDKIKMHTFKNKPIKTSIELFKEISFNYRYVSRL